MSRINVFRSIFTTEADEFLFEEEKKISDLIDIDFENSIIFVNGYRKDSDYILKENDVCTIRVLPGKGNPVDWFVNKGKEAVNGVKNWLNNPRKQFWKFWNGTWDNIGRTLYNWLTPDDNESLSNKTKDSLQSIPTLAGAKNQSGYNSVIPLQLGEHLYTPRFCGNPYHTISGDDGEKQTFHALYMAGYNDVQITDFKLGVVDLAHNKNYEKNGQTITCPTVDNGPIAINGRWDGEKYGIQLELQQGENEVSIYPYKVKEEELGIELIHTSDGAEKLELNRFTEKNPWKVEVEFLLNGLIGYNSSTGAKEDRSVSVQIKMSLDGGTTYVPFAQIEGSNSYDSATGTSTITRRKNKVMRFVARRTFNYNDVINCTNRRVELYIVRTNAKYNDDNSSDDIFLSAIRTWCFDYTKSIEKRDLVPQSPVIASRRNMTARVGLSIVANETDFKNQLESLNFIVTAKGKTWNGSEWIDSHTPNSNPASMALRVLEHKSRGRYAYGASGLNKLDYDSFGELYEWCQQTRSNTDSTPKYKCDGVITSAKKTRDIIDAILSCARARLIVNERKYGVWIDKPRQNSVMILNSQNVLSASNSKSFQDLPDGYKIKFVNKISWQTDELKALYNQSKAEKPNLIFESMEMLFQTDAKQIYQNGKYQLACRKLRPETWSRKVSVDGNLLDIGSKVEIQDDTISVGIGEGAEILELIINDNYITGIKTDGKFFLESPSGRYGVRVTCADGIHEPKVMAWEVTVNQSGFLSDFEFVEPISILAEYKPSIGDILSFGNFERETTEALCFGKRDNGDGTFDLTLVPYQASIYTADNDDVSVDDLVFDSKVSEITQPYGEVPTSVKPVYPTIEQVKTIAHNEASQLRILSTLLDVGVDGEIAVYNGAFFQYSSNEKAWIRLDDKTYLGAYPKGTVFYPNSAAIGSYFLATQDMLIENLLVLHNEENLALSDGTFLELDEPADRGYIYACTATGWDKITDRNDYRYIIAFNDLYAYGFDLPTNYKAYVESTARYSVATYTPTYKGALDHIPAEFHNGDWFCWSGETTADWKYGVIYKFKQTESGGVWVELELDDGENQKEIMSALKDILALNAAGNNDNYYANLFAKVLVSNKAFIDSLAASIITMYKDSSGKGGLIKSQNYNGTVDSNGKITNFGTLGWAIDHDGTADFANMNATGGTFTDITANNIIALTGHFYSGIGQLYSIKNGQTYEVPLDGLPRMIAFYEGQIVGSLIPPYERLNNKLTKPVGLLLTCGYKTTTSASGKFYTIGNADYYKLFLRSSLSSSRIHYTYTDSFFYNDYYKIIIKNVGDQDYYFTEIILGCK